MPYRLDQFLMGRVSIGLPPHSVPRSVVLRMSLQLNGKLTNGAAAGAFLARGYRRRQPTARPMILPTARAH